MAGTFELRGVCSLSGRESAQVYASRGVAGNQNAMKRLAGVSKTRKQQSRSKAALLIRKQTYWLASLCSR